MKLCTGVNVVYLCMIKVWLVGGAEWFVSPTLRPGFTYTDKSKLVQRAQQVCDLLSFSFQLLADNSPMWLQLCSQQLPSRQSQFANEKL